MNERIKQLWTQAGGDYSSGNQHDWPYARIDNPESFAELIVRECLDIALEVRGEPATDTHYVIGYDRACEKMIVGIKEHFGVEQ